MQSVPSQLALFPVWLFLGPRQVGKSSLLKRYGTGRRYVNLDDPQTRAIATTDPIAFGRGLEPPLIIDEIQYAPQLLSSVKILADATRTPGLIWLTGSQEFEALRGVRESLAGRVALLNLLGLSDEEKGREIASESALFSSIWESTFPRVFPDPTEPAWDLYMSSYVQTYIERDVRELLGVQKRREFEVFLKICALRTGQRVNFDELGRDAGVSGVTAKEWISVLEDSYLLRLVHPYHSNRTKRLVKQPKLFFLDMGIAAYLAGWRSAEMLRLGPMRGAVYETHIFGQLLRYFKHRALDAEITYLRSKDNEEIDFLVEHRGRVFPIEAKCGDVRTDELPAVAKFREPNWSIARVLTPSVSDPVGHIAPARNDWLLCSSRHLGFLTGGR
ncbi:MAG: ATP-binding protein [Planctomycetes bacterium]|nr:ATP-binding protein [Planctomycetota bacterium]